MSSNKFFKYSVVAFVAAGGILLPLLSVEWLLGRDTFAVTPINNRGQADVQTLARRAALVRGEFYDRRTLSQVITDERALGKRVFPTASPTYFLAERGSSVLVRGTPVLPLGLSAKADHYYCNESGRYANFVTDRFGFRNPDAVWDGSVDVVAVGDSFTMGSCLDEEDSLIGQLRAGGQRILNLGMGANGPLIELAALVEYARWAKPKSILWFFFPNDFEDLDRELENSILPKYLHTDFSQGLMGRAKEIGPVIDAVVEKYWVGVRTSVSPVENFAFFPNLNNLIRFVRLRYAEPRTGLKPPKTEVLLSIIDRAQSEAKRAGARFLFVYLPDCVGHSYGQDRWKKPLLDSLTTRGVTVVDTEGVIGNLSRQGKLAYFYCPGSHFNASGARSAAFEVLPHLLR